MTLPYVWQPLAKQGSKKLEKSVRQPVYRTVKEYPPVFCPSNAWLWKDFLF